MTANIPERDAEGAGKFGQYILMTERFRSNTHYPYGTVSAMRKDPTVSHGGQAEMHFQVPAEVLFSRPVVRRCMADQGNGDLSLRETGPYSPRDNAVNAICSDDVPCLIRGCVRSHFHEVRMNDHVSTFLIWKEMCTRFDRLFQEEGIKFVTADKYGDPVPFRHFERIALKVDSCSKTFQFPNIWWQRKVKVGQRLLRDSARAWFWTGEPVLIDKRRFQTSCSTCARTTGTPRPSPDDDHIMHVSPPCPICLHDGQLTVLS